MKYCVTAKTEAEIISSLNQIERSIIHFWLHNKINKIYIDWLSIGTLSAWARNITKSQNKLKSTDYDEVSLHGLVNYFVLRSIYNEQSRVAKSRNLVQFSNPIWQPHDRNSNNTYMLYNESKTVIQINREISSSESFRGGKFRETREMEKWWDLNTQL